MLFLNEHTHLRALHPERDGPALHAFWSDEESCRYLPDPAFASVEETIAKLQEWTKGFEDTSWAIAEQDSDVACGRVALFTQGRNVWEAACMVVPGARGCGLAAKALAIAIDDVFERKAARRVFADIDPDNVRSIRTFERLGFAYEGCLRGEWETHIGIRDSMIYGLLHDDPRPWK
jgi:RimJ/RimL family protein N-acetyltransferase